MSKRAAIYIRTSSERLAEKVSPREQEETCLKLADERGYLVAKVYRDVERYRVRKKLVEPTGTRADRPGLCQMIADGKAGLFDVILAWKEDRLYRGFRPMLDVLELVEQHDVDIELVRETFDRRMTPGKAWIARLELENMRDRILMGREGRVKDGKILGDPRTLGYDIVDGKMLINEEEAETVRFIFNQVAWGDAEYPGGVPIHEVRRRLIAMGARQKIDGPRRAAWARGVIYAILNRPSYLGTMRQRVNGDVYEIAVPPIIDTETFDRVRERLENGRRPVTGATRECGFLLAGLVYAPCGHKLHYNVLRYAYGTRANGQRVRYMKKRPLAYCYCPATYDDRSCDFRRLIKAAQLEQAVWDKVTPFLLDPENIKEVASVLIEKWQGNREQHQADVERLERQLERLAEERQWVIIQGRKGVLTQSDMEHQLGLLSLEERDTRRELTDTRQTVTASAGLFAMMTELAGFLSDNQGELEKLAAVPLREMSPEQLKTAQKWVDAVVERVDLKGDGDDLNIQTNPFGLLHTVFSKSSPATQRLQSQNSNHRLPILLTATLRAEPHPGPGESGKQAPVNDL